MHAKCRVSLTSWQPTSNGMYGSVQVAEVVAAKIFVLSTTNSLLLVLSKTGMDVEQRTFLFPEK